MARRPARCVNAFEPAAPVLTSVALDHMEYLGDTRERIGWRRRTSSAPAAPRSSGTRRAGRGDDHAAPIGAVVTLLGRDFGLRGRPAAVALLGPVRPRGAVWLTRPCAARVSSGTRDGDCALDSLRHCLPLSAQAIRDGLARVELSGRFQVLPGRPVVILDVAHNPQAAAVLSANLADMGAFGAPWRSSACCATRTSRAGGRARGRSTGVRGHPGQFRAARRRTEVAVAIKSACPGAVVEAFASPRGALAAAREAASKVIESSRSVPSIPWRM